MFSAWPAAVGSFQLVLRLQKCGQYVLLSGIHLYLCLVSLCKTEGYIEECECGMSHISTVLNKYCRHKRGVLIILLSQRLEKGVIVYITDSVGVRDIYETDGEGAIATTEPLTVLVCKFSISQFWPGTAEIYLLFRQR